jgi:hypothetical protein
LALGWRGHKAALLSVALLAALLAALTVIATHFPTIHAF